jgi:hypothetical protein
MLDTAGYEPFQRFESIGIGYAETSSKARFIAEGVLP